MATRAQKVRLALFFIVASSILVTFIIAIAGTHLLRKRDHYTIEFSETPVSGLTKGAAVKYLGFNVGRVEDISISPTDVSTVVVEISVERRNTENAIRTDTEARMAALGITGLKYIELFGGSNSAEILPSDARIKASDTFFSNLQERAEVLSAKLEDAVSNLNRLLGPENQREFSRLLTNTSNLMATANDLMQDNRHSLDSTVSQVAATSGNLARATDAMAATMDSLHSLFRGQKLQQTIDDLQISAAGLRGQMDGPMPLLIARMDSMVRNIDRTFIGIDQTVGASRQNLLRAMQDLEETLQNIRETTELIRENPSVLIRGGGRSGASE